MVHQSAAGSSSSAFHDFSQPPGPFSDFQFSFDSASYLYPSDHPPMPPSIELFSPSETSNLFGFLDNFNFEFDTDGLLPDDGFQPFPQDDLHTVTAANGLTASTSSLGMNGGTEDSTGIPNHRPHPSSSHKRKSRSPSSNASPPDNNGSTSPNSSRNSKALLTTPQKRMNHIMSEQKRRNAIREGYAQLTTLLAPPGAAPGEGMPTRGRPKGSGSRGKGQVCKGKSGVLLRAVEYCRWLEESRDALLDEVKRVEAAAGIQVAG